MKFNDALMLKGLVLIKPKIFKDKRGFFLEGYRKNRFFDEGINIDFIQENHSFSIYGTIRGMHFQENAEQDKLINVVNGKIFDVAVDIRQNSPTFGQWQGVILDGEKCYSFFIPKGFAHGFCVLTQNAHLVYKVSSYYAPKLEKSFRWNDPYVNITWPIKKPILSEKDAKACFLKDIFVGK